MVLTPFDYAAIAAYLIAITLFAILIATAAWWVFSQVKSTTAPTATPTAPSK